MNANRNQQLFQDGIHRWAVALDLVQAEIVVSIHPGDSRFFRGAVYRVALDQRLGELALILLWKDQAVPHAVKLAVESLHSECRRGSLQAFAPVVENYTGSSIIDRLEAGFAVSR